MRACVLSKLNAPLDVCHVGPDDMRYGQVIVKIKMAGLCGAQLQEIRGDKAAEYIPHLLGHEGVGIVEAVGEGVALKEGQRVVLHWMKGAGADIGATRYYAERIGNVTAGPCHTWATHAVVSENRCTPIPDDVPDELGVLLGCALSTALGVCENEAKLKMGESVLVVGCGGVGLCCIAAAKAMGCDVYASDRSPEARYLAQQIGAVVDRGPCVDCMIDTTGSPEAIEQWITMLAPSGRCILVGQPVPYDAFLKIPNARSLFDGTGKTIKATQGGSCNPAKDFARWIHAWKSGVLKINGIVTHSYCLDEVNEALDMLRSGKAGRIVLTMP